MRNLAVGMALALAAIGCGGGGSDADAGGDGDADAATGGPDAGPTPTVSLATYQQDTQIPLPFLAVQDGDGPWQQIASVDGTYELDVPSSRYGLVYMCEALTSCTRPTPWPTTS